jgi:ketosteroid isomerase-like protein
MRVLLILLLGVTACQPGRGPDPEQVRATIDRTNRLLERLYAEGQVDSAAMFFTEDVWQMPPNAPPIVGRDAYREWWSQAVGWGAWQFDLSMQDVVVTGAIAVERGKYTLSFEARPEVPMPSFEDRGNYVAVWRLEPDGQWRIVWDAPVSELPPGSAVAE